MELFNGNPFLEVFDYEFTAWYELDEKLVRLFRVLNIISENGKLDCTSLAFAESNYGGKSKHDETELKRNADVKHNLNMARKAGGF